METRVPAVNISETENNYHVELATPGLKKEDFKLNLERNNLSISVEASSDHQDNHKNYSKRKATVLLCELNYRIAANRQE